VISIKNKIKTLFIKGRDIFKINIYFDGCEIIFKNKTI
jgi:hypothetical protein